MKPQRNAEFPTVCENVLCQVVKPTSAGVCPVYILCGLPLRTRTCKSCAERSLGHIHKYFVYLTRLFPSLQPRLRR